MKYILDSTDTISENITNLAATSEEVAAATSGLKTSEIALQNMDSCKKVLDEICSLQEARPH